MSFNEGAMIEPLAVAVHAAKRFPELAGAKVAILGSGPIGILLAQSCKALGAAQGSLPISPTPGWSWPGAVGRTSQ